MVSMVFFSRSKGERVMYTLKFVGGPLDGTERTESLLRSNIGSI